MTPLEQYLAAIRKTNMLTFEPWEIWSALIRIGVVGLLAAYILSILISLAN